VKPFLLTVGESRPTERRAVVGMQLRLTPAGDAKDGPGAAKT